MLIIASRTDSIFSLLSSESFPAKNLNASIIFLSFAADIKHIFEKAAMLQFSNSFCGISIILVTILGKDK